MERTRRRTREVASKGVPLGYEPFPKQRDFHASPAKYRLFGGAAGPGKTKALLMEAILQAHEHPGANTLLLRRTFPELEQSLLLYFRRDVPRELYKNFNESKHVVTWQNGSTTRFGYCQSESDVYQYQGAEFLFIGIDELTLFTLRQWQFLTSRNRCPISGAFPNMAGATNPGNIGHAWVKSLWIDKQPAPGMENASEYDPADYDFISARVSDNPVYAHDENYLKTLRALPSHLRRAFLDGNWDVFAGQYFDNFDCSRHVLRAEQVGALRDRDADLSKDEPSLEEQRRAQRESACRAGEGSQVPGEGSLGDWKSWWPRWISIDWGFEHPAAVYWHCAIRNGSRSAGFDSANLNLPVPHPRGIRGGGNPDDDPCGDAAHSSPAPVGSCPVGAQHAVPGAALVAGNHEQDVAAAQVSGNGEGAPSISAGHSSAMPLQEQNPSQCVVTYREYVTRRTTPRDLAYEIVRRSVQFRTTSSVGAQHAVPGADSWRDGAHPSTALRPRGVIPNPVPTFSVGDECEGSAFGSSVETQQRIPRRPENGHTRDDAAQQGSGAREKIDAIYLSPDAFAHRTGEASIAEQMGDVFAAAGLPRPVPADDDRVGGWMLMYQMLDASLRRAQRDSACRVGQGSQVDGESSLGEWYITDNCFELIRTLPSLVRDPIRVEDIEKCDGDDPADAARYGLKSRYAAHRGDPGGWRSRMPLADRIAAHAYSADPTIRAMQSRKFYLEESGKVRSDKFPRGPQRIPFRHGPRRH